MLLTFHVIMITPCMKTETFFNDLLFVCADGQFLRMEIGEFQYTHEHACVDKISHGSLFLQV